jgi:hypothetical protein
MSDNHTKDPMLKTPRRLPGAKPEPLSPFAFLEATLVRSHDVGENLSPSFGLAEEEVGSISAEGIRLMGETFKSSRLTSFISKRPSGKRGRFIALFDYADAVRGALDSIDLYEEDRAGRRRLLFAVPNIHAPQPDPTPAEIERERRAHEKALLAIRDNRRLQLQAVRRGEEAQERLLEAEAERTRHRKTVQYDPKVAAPIEAATEAPGRQTEQALNRNTSAGRAESPSGAERMEGTQQSTEAPQVGQSTTDRLSGTDPSGFEEE